MDIYQFTARGIDGRVQSLADYRGEVLLIVNVASKCGDEPVSLDTNIELALA